MKTLSELQALSLAALAHGWLVDVAVKYSPASAFDEARGRGWDDLRSESCKTLATVRQEYGEEEFRATIERFYKANLLDYLEQAILPQIQLIEKVAQAPLLISTPSYKGQTLSEWLQSLPTEMDLRIQAGNFSLALHSRVFHVDYDDLHGHTYGFAGAFCFKDSAGAVLAEHSWEWYSGYRVRATSQYFFQRRFLEELNKILGARSLCITYEEHKGGWKLTVITALLDFYERHGWGEKLPLRLDQDKKIMSKIQAGEVEEARVLMRRARKFLVRKGSVKPQFLACLDFEVQVLLNKAKQWRRYHDRSVPLIDKVLDGTVEGSFRPIAIAGGKAARSYTFFLQYDYGYDIFIDPWVRVLTVLGYGGSVLIASYNYPSMNYIVGTGQIDALFEYDWCSCGNGVRVLQRKGEEAGFGKVPLFYPQLLQKDIFSPIPTDEEFVEGLGLFLSQHFPLK